LDGIFEIFIYPHGTNGYQVDWSVIIMDGFVYGEWERKPLHVHQAEEKPLDGVSTAGGSDDGLG
jgi:hypothetical protein